MDYIVGTASAARPARARSEEQVCLRRKALRGTERSPFRFSPFAFLPDLGSHLGWPESPPCLAYGLLNDPSDPHFSGRSVSRPASSTLHDPYCSTV